MKVVHVGIPNQVYWEQLATSCLDQAQGRAILGLLEERSLARVVVFGVNRETGRLLRDLVGPRFVGYLNRETLDAGLNLDFDAVLLGVSPRAYREAVAQLSTTFADRSFTIVSLFDDDPDLRHDSQGRRVPVEPCLLDHVLIRHNGEVLPCCQLFTRQDKVVCNIGDAEVDLAQALRDFDMECSCAGKGFRPLRPSEALAIDRVICELSLRCNAKCAMCCVHSPQYTQERGSGLAPVVDYAAIERALQSLRPGAVNFQGGEVLIDPDSLAWIRRLRDKMPWLRLTLVTNGNAGERAAQEALELFDHCVIDFYGFQPFTYQTITGLPLARTMAFAERLLAQDRRRVTLKYLSTPINFHESVLFLEWALERGPSEIAVIDADSDWYIKNDPLLQIPTFDPYCSTDILPDIYWSRIISRTTERLRRLVRHNASRCRERGIRLLFWGGLFYTYPVPADAGGSRVKRAGLEAGAEIEPAT